VWKSTAQYAAVGVPYDIYATVARGQAAGIHTNAHLDHDPMFAPLSAGERVGELTVADNTGVVVRAPLVSLGPVPVGGLWTRLSDSVSLWFHH
jgi:D-alanyl-D-alanine carboxypeptidase (penicillin-binding protein 5/6)